MAYSNNRLDLEIVNEYLLKLLEVDQCSHAHCNQAINAIKIGLQLYDLQDLNLIRIVRPQKDKLLPKALSMNEVKKLLDSTVNLKHKTALMLAYSCGLKVSEVASL